MQVQRQTKPGYKGWWERIIPQLDDEKRASLIEAAKSDEISHTTISVVLERWGYDVRPDQIGRWRRTHVLR
jgi:hypothetical protein